MDWTLFFVRISRPRFWIYLAGPFIVGCAFASTSYTTFLNPIFYFLLFLFILPANLFLYGVNDLFDRETDLKNPKKKTREVRASIHALPQYNKAVFIAFVIIVLVSFAVLSNPSKMLVMFFLFLSYFYSAPPIRFKSKPLFDFSSNILYAIPGFIGYYEFSHMMPSVIVILALFCWTGAMHLFSAIPDIVYDRRAKIQTTATLLGQQFSLWLCVLLWGIFLVMAVSISSVFIVGLVYPMIPILLIFYKKISIERVYWYFPKFNAIMGFLLFLYAISSS